MSGLRGASAPSVIMAVVRIGIQQPLLSGSHLAAIASAVVYGSSVLALVASVIAVARRSLEPAYWAQAFAWLTVGVAAGQCLGPCLPSCSLTVRPGACTSRPAYSRSAR